MTLFFLLVFSLDANALSLFGSRSEVLSKSSAIRHVKQMFRENVSDAYAITRRGEYTLVEPYTSSLAAIKNEIGMLEGVQLNKPDILHDLEDYEHLVMRTADALKKSAPLLHHKHLAITQSVTAFNKKIAGIGLRELLEEWRKLSAVKSRFIKNPNARLAGEFEKSWSIVQVSITELYLDEELEEPLFDFLEQYRAHFEELAQAYRSVGYENVASIKQLGYKIKMRLEMLPSSM